MTTRLTSSGIDQSRLRRPGLDMREQRAGLRGDQGTGQVELTSPTTTTTSGRSSASKRLERRHHPARLNGVAARARRRGSSQADGCRRSAKKTSFIAGS